MSDESKRACLEVLTTLDKEEKEDKECRDQFNVRWQRLSSYQLNAGLRKRVEDYKAKVDLAQKSDSLIENKIQSASQFFSLFTLSRQQLDASMPKSDHDDSGNSSKLFADLKKLLSELDSCFEKENDLDRQVKLQMETEHVEKEFILKQQNLEKAIGDQVGVYDTKYLSVLSKLGETETSLCSQIVTLYQQLLQLKGSKGQTAREKVVQDAFTSINKYDEISANIQEGIRFYTTLQDYIRKERNKVEDFCFARRTEKNDIISNLQIQITGISQEQFQNPYQQQYQQPSFNPQYQNPNPWDKKH